MKIAEQKHPFYKPLWRRIVIIATIAAWFGIELAQGGSGLWAVLAGGILAYAIWVFLISFPKDDAAPPA